MAYYQCRIQGLQLLGRPNYRYVRTDTFSQTLFKYPFASEQLRVSWLTHE